MISRRNHKIIQLIIVLILFLNVLVIMLLSVQNSRGMFLSVFSKSLSSSSLDSSLLPLTLKSSKWQKNRLVIIPAIYQEINWFNHSSWPHWLREGLDLFTKNHSRSYDIYLYQRFDPNCKYPFNWPYCQNIHEESGVYLKFIYDYYYDLPDKMLFLHGKPNQHSLYPIEAAQCIRDDVYYTTVNDLWLYERPWITGIIDPKDNLTLMYKCAQRLLTLFGFNSEAQLNPTNKIPSDDNVFSTMCCAQFYVRKERIHHYTYKQWSSVYNASLQPYCTSELDREYPGAMTGMKWFGGSLEYIWHIILGLHSTNMPPPVPKTNTDLCHIFHESCQGTLCRDSIIKFLYHPKQVKPSQIKSHL